MSGGEVNLKLKNRKAIWNIIGFTGGGLLVLTTLMFLFGHVGSLFGRYYIPEKASLISICLCMMWLLAICILGYIFAHLQNDFVKIHKRFTNMITIVLGIIVSMVLIWGCFSYNLNLDIKIEKYDEHIGLYVDNTFIRVEYRHPYYMYEENWLMMRKLTEDEMSEVSKKYGKSEDYYN